MRICLWTSCCRGTTDGRYQILSGFNGGAFEASGTVCWDQSTATDSFIAMSMREKKRKIVLSRTIIRRPAEVGYGGGRCVMPSRCLEPCLSSLLPSAHLALIPLAVHSGHAPETHLRFIYDLFWLYFVTSYTPVLVFDLFGKLYRPYWSLS